MSIERENLEMQELRSNNLLLTEQLIDYPKIKRQRNVAYILAILGAILTAAALIVAIVQKGE